MNKDFRDLPSLKAGIRDFEAKWGERLGIENTHEMRQNAENNHLGPGTD